MIGGVFCNHSGIGNFISTQLSTCFFVLHFCTFANNNESMVSLVSRRYMRGKKGTESLVCLCEYLPSRSVYHMSCLFE